MKACIVAVGQRMPDWAQSAYDDFAKRFAPEHRVVLKTVKAEPRTSGKTPAAMMLAERSRIEAAIPQGTYVIALDERGASLTTLQLATKIKGWERQAPQVAFIIGGPDGLDPEFKSKAHERMRLSDMTLPHAFARVLLIEQLYRAWSINAGHPYHRE